MQRFKGKKNGDSLFLTTGLSIVNLLAGVSACLRGPEQTEQDDRRWTTDDDDAEWNRPSSIVNASWQDVRGKRITLDSALSPSTGGAFSQSTGQKACHFG
jgi:hypothetical protein